MDSYINVYVYKYPFNYERKPICKVRREYIKNANLGGTIDDSYYVWRLAEIACKEVCNCSIDSLNPRLTETGKWVFDNCYISLSHSGGYVMVGISNEPIGVDVQKVMESGYDHVIDEMCVEELEYYKNKNAWEAFKEHTESEAYFKCYGNGAINWKEINTLLHKNELVTYSMNYEEFYFSICSPLLIRGINLIIKTNFDKDSISIKEK